MTEIVDLNEDGVKISRLCRIYFPRNYVSKSVTVGSARIELGRVGPGQFIVLDDSASFKMVIKIYFNFFKVLELFECRRGDPCMTDNMNFVRFAHS